MLRPSVAAAWVAVLLGASVATAETTLVTPASGGAGDFRIARWTTADGLPQNTVTDVVGLPSGELWLATFGGLARFDGRTFRVLDMAADEGLPANRIVKLAAVGPDSFLFLTQQGHLGRVEGGRAALLVPPPLPSLEALDLVVDGADRAWCRAADGRVWRTDGRGGWRSVVDSPGGQGALHAVALDQSGEVWSAWGRRLLRLSDDARGKGVALADEKVALAPRAGGGLWIGLVRGVARLVDGRLDPLSIRPELEEKVHAIAPVSHDVLWLATDSGLSRIDRQADGSWRRSSLPLPLSPTGSVRSLHVDSHGGLWVGTVGEGLLRVNRLPTRRFGTESGLRDVAALAPDGAGGAFVASVCHNLLHLDGSGEARVVPLPVGEGPVQPCGVSLAAGPGSSVLVRWGTRLLRVRRGWSKPELVADDLPLEEGPIVSRPDGSAWVASRSGSVRLVSPEGRRTSEIAAPPPLMSAAVGPDGALWLGGDGEVIRLRGDALERWGASANVPRGLVRDVLPEPDGSVWIGTYGGGIGRLRGGRAGRITAEQGLPDNSVSRILDDGLGRLWISTNRGLAVVRKTELVAVAEGRARAVDPVVLGPERGVAEANFGSPAGFADAFGRLWFGTIFGAVSVLATSFPFNDAPPEVRIEEVWADGRLLGAGPEVVVPPRSARLRLGFTAFAPEHPERMRYRLRIEGTDADWVDAGAATSVDWPPPGPGRHRVLVEARNEDGVWSLVPAAVVLDVRPAWWQAPGFQVAAVLALALAVGTGVRRRIERIERQHADRLRVLEEQREAEERVASLRAQLERVSRVALAGELATSLAHEVRQPIGAIVNNAEAVKRDLARYARRPEELEQVVGDIVADALRASDVVAGLRAFLGTGGPSTTAVDLSALVREMLPLVRRELEDNRVAVALDLAERLPPVEGQRVQLGQIVVNLVVNACEALAGAPGERRVVVSTAERDGRVELAVADNGPGPAAEVKDRLFEPFVTTKADGLGVGLAICRSIAERHGGRLMAQRPPEGGLRLVLTLPPARSGELRA